MFRLLFTTMPCVEQDFQHSLSPVIDAVLSSDQLTHFSSNCIFTACFYSQVVVVCVGEWVPVCVCAFNLHGTSLFNSSPYLGCLRNLAFCMSVIIPVRMSGEFFFCLEILQLW